MEFGFFCLVYFVWVFIGALAVTGWYFITRGEEKVMEDGSKKRIGKVFKNWYFFWTKVKPQKMKIFFDEAHLYELYLKIKVKFHVGGTVFDIKQEGSYFMISQSQKWFEEMKWIEGAYDMKFQDQGGGKFQVYKEYDDFVYPYWVRDPLAVCATCFSSIYGSVVYWLLVALPKESVFAWSGTPWLAAICFWIAFCFSLAVVNTALAKRFN